MKNSLRLTLRSAFFEAVFVVFGVVLALAANEWRQEVKAQERAESALDSMKLELQTNLDLVVASRNYHESQAEKLQGMIAQKQTPSMRDFPKGYIHPRLGHRYRLGGRQGHRRAIRPRIPDDPGSVLHLRPS